MQQNLHPGAKWLFRLRAFSIVLPFIFFFSFFIAAIIAAFSGRGNFSSAIILSSAAFWLFGVVALILLIEVYARMAYNRWKYEFTQEGIKIEHGIIWKKYTSIPYWRIQNVNIHRGIIARLSGFSSVEMETAGASGMVAYSRPGHWQKHYHSEGYLPAVSINEAEKIREYLLDKISRQSKKKAHDGEGL